MRPSCAWSLRRSLSFSRNISSQPDHLGVELGDLQAELREAVDQVSTGGETISMATIDGSDVLVDANGDALYSPEQEANGQISCTGACEKIWVPLTVSGGMKPTASADVTGPPGTVKRPDGSLQVTLDGAPLYTFTEDGGPGKVTGDGFSDQFDGKSFTWHVVTVGGSAGSDENAPSTTTSSSSGGAYSY